MLKVDVIGSGPDLVVLHGWALHCGLFDGVADVLTDRFRVHFIDLPGHGHNADRAMPADIDTLARQVLNAAPLKAHWLGWSLGGMVVLAAASLSPGRVNRLVTVASTPKFVVGPDWPQAIPQATLDEMATALRDDFRSTVKNFLSLQVLGDENAFVLLRELRAQAYAHGDPAPVSLGNGLTILRDTDLRPRLKGIDAPLLAVMGSRDRLAPPAAGQALADLARNGRCVTIAKAAHAPFISHPEEFLAAVENFFSESAKSGNEGVRGER